MKILAVDTTTRFLCLGIYDDGKIYEYSLEVGRRLSSLLSVTIKRILDILGWQLEDIDYFACGLGPGSFTGVRVGLATIKGLAWVLKKPILGIPTLDIIARNAKASRASYVLPIIDAKRNLIYCSIYKVGSNELKRVMPYMLLTEKEFFTKAKTNSVILGDAVSLYKEKIIKDLKGVTLLDKDYWYPQARNIIALALGRIKAKKFVNPFDVKPIYLYPKECQVKSGQKSKSNG